MRNKIFCFTCALVLTTTAVYAAEIDVAEVSAELYNEIAVPNEYDNFGGTVMLYQPPAGKVVCGVSFKLTVTFNDDAPFQLPRKEIGIPGAMRIGWINEFGVAAIEPEGPEAVSGPAIYLHKPFDTKTVTHVRRVLYLVPEEKKEASFQLRDKKFDLKLPEKATAFDPTRCVACKVLEIKRLKAYDAKPVSWSGTPQPFQRKLVNEGGSILAVKVAWEFKGLLSQSAIDETHRGYDLRRVFLTFAQGGRALCLGAELQDGRLSDRGPSFRDVSGPQTAVLLFPVPANVTQFELNYQGRPLATLKAP